MTVRDLLIIVGIILILLTLWIVSSPYHNQYTLYGKASAFPTSVEHSDGCTIYHYPDTETSSGSQVRVCHGKTSCSQQLP